MKNVFLFEIQYLGFRYHGWQKQAGLKTVQGTIENLFCELLKSDEFTIITASRTDSMVSALQSYFLLTTKLDCSFTAATLNSLLPPDIKILGVEKKSSDFALIKNAVSKEYHYTFYSGQKAHPFNAPFMAQIEEDLDVEAMKMAARLFEGEHWFGHFCSRPREGQDFMRTIESCHISENKEFITKYSPENSYRLEVVGKSFVQHQVRLMMGALMMIGLKQLSCDDLTNLLREGSSKRAILLAPASGLVLGKVLLKERPHTSGAV